MQRQPINSESWRTPLRHSRTVLTYVSVALGVALSGFTAAIAADASAKFPHQSQAPQQSQAQSHQLAKSTPVRAAQASPTRSPQASTQALPDGVYLFGQSTKPDQVGSAYLVMEVKNNRTIGAFYMPRSSFDCVYGNFQPNRLALTVVDSYDRSTNPYEIALRQDTPTNAAGTNAAVKQVGLDGMHRLSSLSENDQRILGVCKANYPQALN